MDENQAQVGCVWNPIKVACEVSTTEIYQALADSGNDPSDRVCAVFSFFAEAGCESIFDETTCLANEQCEFNADGNCSCLFNTFYVFF